MGCHKIQLQPSHDIGKHIATEVLKLFAIAY